MWLGEACIFTGKTCLNNPQNIVGLANPGIHFQSVSARALLNERRERREKFPPFPVLSHPQFFYRALAQILDLSLSGRRGPIKNAYGRSLLSWSQSVCMAGGNGGV